VQAVLVHEDAVVRLDPSGRIGIREGGVITTYFRLRGHRRAMTSDEEPDFTREFARFQRDAGRRRTCEPGELLAQWSSFVESCVQGYRDDVADYFNEVMARDALQRAFDEPALARFPELAPLRRTVEDIDQRFREILRPDAFTGIAPERWWRRGVVTYGSARLAEELDRGSGIQIDTR